MPIVRAVAAAERVFRRLGADGRSAIRSSLCGRADVPRWLDLAPLKITQLGSPQTVSIAEQNPGKPQSLDGTQKFSPHLRG